MTTKDFIAKLGALDVRLWVENERLGVSAPQGILTPDLRDELIRRKPELISAVGASTVGPIRTTTEDDAAPLSFAQERLWIFDRLEPGSTTYNTQLLLELEGELDRTALSRSLDEVVRRHEPLRTTFQDGDGGPVQVVSPAAPVDLRVVDLTTVPPSQRDEEARRVLSVERNTPFRLDEDPLLRATLLRKSADSHVLLLATHHIVADGSSLIVLVRELTELYGAFVRGEAASLPALPIRFSDYAHWEREWLDGAAAAELVSYWRDRLGGELPVLDLPTDRIRPPVQTFRGGAIGGLVDTDTAERLRRLAQQAGATLFTLLLAAFKAMLYRHCGQEDVLVGAAVQGRERPETRDLIGMFVNTVAIRSDLSGQPTFRQLLGRVRASVLGALAHRELPFEKVVEVLNPPRDRSRSPVFQVLFNTFNVEAPEEILLPGLRVSAPDVPELLSWIDVESKFDLTVYSRETSEGLQLHLVYNTDLFDPDRMEALLGHFRRLLSLVADDPDRRIGDIDLLSETEHAAALRVPAGVGRARSVDSRGGVDPARDVVSRFA